MFISNRDCNINTNKLLKIVVSDGIEEEEKILQFSGKGRVDFQIKIPYEFNIIDDNPIYNNILFNSFKIFNFKEFVEPRLPTAGTNNRLEVKIIELPDPSNGKFKIERNSNEIHATDILEINENIKFDPIDNIEKYGHFL